MSKTRALKKTNPLLLKGICHRGLHNDKYSENGLLAFQNAKDHNMAFELDVHLTRDNQIVVSHDSNLVRLTGKDGIIEELTFDEIRANYRLKDGGVVPSLKEVFEQTNEEVPIVIELKSYHDNYKMLAKQVKEELKAIKDKNNIAIISFDPRALIPFLHRGYALQYLVCEGRADMFKFAKYFPQLDIEFTMVSLDYVQKYAKNHLVNVWTIESKENFDKSLPYIDMVTFQHMDEQYIIEKMSEKHNLK